MCGGKSINIYLIHLMESSQSNPYTHTNTHTYTHIHIYLCVYVYTCMYHGHILMTLDLHVQTGVDPPEQNEDLEYFEEYVKAQ